MRAPPDNSRQRKRRNWRQRDVYKLLTKEEHETPYKGDELISDAHQLLGEKDFIKLALRADRSRKWSELTALLTAFVSGVFYS